jgi:hypothetical protein
MKVKATREGYYDLKRRKVGSVFILHDPKAFSENWMERLDKSNTPKAKAKEVNYQAEEVDQEEDII